VNKKNIELREFTERIKVRREMIQAEKFASVGLAINWLIAEVARLRLRLDYLEFKEKERNP
jgi:hypothetical protein